MDGYSGKTKAACFRQWGIPWTTLQKWVDACTIAKKKCTFAPIFENVSELGYRDNRYSKKVNLFSITDNQFRIRVKNIRLLISTSSNSVNLFQE